MKKLYIFTWYSLIFLLLTSCVSTITRWSGQTSEKGSRSLPLTLSVNIFDDFLWTTPPLYSKELKTYQKEGKTYGTIDFARTSYTFLIESDFLKSTADSMAYTAKVSKQNYYYNLDILKTKIVTRQRLVTKTRFVTTQVAVTKSVPVSRTRTVTSFNPDGSTSYRTETYTDYETRTEYETRTVPETYTEWETVYERVLDIPEYVYYKVILDNRFHILIYKIEDPAGTTRYFYQNVTYFSTSEAENNRTLKMLHIDADSDGIYFEDNDRMLYNIWNPYERNSEYAEISGYLDNYWYRYHQLSIDKFLSFSAENDFSRLQINSANNEYIGSEKKGTFQITGLPYDDALVYVNGDPYFHTKKGILEKEIEYGIHRLMIKHEGYMELEQVFIINDSSPSFIMEYQPSGPAGTFEFLNDYLRSWVITVTGEDGESKHYFNRNKISLQAGSYTVVISSGGYNITKEIKINPGSSQTVNYKTELEKIISEQ